MGPEIVLLLGTASSLLADIAKLIGTPFDGAVQKSVIEEVSTIISGVKDLFEGDSSPTASEKEAVLIAAEELKKQHDRIKFHNFGVVDPPVPTDPAVPADTTPTEPGVSTQGWG